MPCITSQQVLESASYPAIANDGRDPGDETGQWQRGEKQIPPSHGNDMLQESSHVTPQHDADGEYLNPQ